MVTAPDQQHVSDVAVDASGNVYFTGSFYGTVNFNPAGSDEYTASGVGDVYITKYSSDGTYDWTKTYGAGGSDSGSHVGFDNSGNMYLLGGFSNTVDFNPGGDDGVLSDGGSLKSFLIKYTIDGTFVWVKLLQGSNQFEIEVSGSIFLVGSFQGTKDFDLEGTGDSHSSDSSTRDAFITKLDTDGNYFWTKTWGSTGADYAYSISLDNSENMYISGTFVDTVDFDPGSGTDNQVSLGLSDVFLTKYSSDGTYDWTKTYGTADDENISQNYLAVEPAGNSYIGGYTSLSGSCMAPPCSSGFLLKYDNDGTQVWTKSFDGADSNAPGPVAADASGNVYLAGYFGEGLDDSAPSIDLNPDGTPQVRTGTGAEEIFLVKYKNDGTFDWAYTIGGTTPWDPDWGYTFFETAIPNDVTVTDSGTLYITGTLSSGTGTGFVKDPDDVTHTINGINSDLDDYYNVILTKISAAASLSVSSSSISDLLNSNVFEAQSDTDTDEINVNQDVRITVSSGSNTDEVLINDGTVISSTDGLNINPSLLEVSIPELTQMQNLGSDDSLIGALQWGIPSIGLQFSEPITIKSYVGTQYDGETLEIKRSISGTSEWTTDGIVAPGTCVVDDGYCEFQTTKASYFAVLRNNVIEAAVSGSSSGDAYSCGDVKPIGVPDLFQIDTYNGKAALYFTPLADTDRYFISFSTKSFAEEHGADIILGNLGVQLFEANYLTPDTTYYFKVRGQNGCMPGDWSTTMKITTPNKHKKTPSIFYKYSFLLL
ncbi:hypothetical protein A2Z33_05105 [Candidatus Gottesmanbacteria bacterium RBG_16_52_11]|uniref:Fibronectin type-III domain-containing protein n=1 Tax=Candidatus Gottesmanbacteria bacterium RBG_16_52_11 TaxID=1798374 RepID=A0A1F5YQD0_9BACT|nr:MAG: hypothetical protein A2Z33_05105 [Candidatus Gottesmanbacteria bacterium RBG_16_52_11]